MSESTPKVTVIMRSKNSDWVIAQALAGLFSQDFTDFELMVVDSGSTDRTLEIVKQYPCTLIEIEPGNYYPGAVLNMAIEKAGTDIVVFQNSDVAYLFPQALGRLVAAFDEPDVQAAFARQMPRPDAETWVRRDYTKSFSDADEAPPWITLSLPLAAMRKSIWQHHHFYTNAWASEDTEWGNWARNNGHKIKYVPDAVVMHSHNYTLRQIYGRRFVEGEADAFIYDDHESVATMLRKYCVATARDMLCHVKTMDIGGLLFTPARLFVYHWAHYKGRQLGERRKTTGDTDTSAGQATVMSRYER